MPALFSLLPSRPPSSLLFPSIPLSIPPSRYLLAGDPKPELEQSAASQASKLHSWSFFFFFPLGNSRTSTGTGVQFPFLLCLLAHALGNFQVIKLMSCFPISKLRKNSKPPVGLLYDSSRQRMYGALHRPA